MRHLKFHQSYACKIDSPQLGRFYKRNGHKGRIKPEDLCCWLSNKNDILAALRICEISPDVHILRGMWVSKRNRRQGIGGELIRTFITKNRQLAERLFCFAYPESAGFYLKHGFISSNESEVPKQVYVKWKNYSQRGQITVLMRYKREGIPESSHSINTLS